MKQILFYITIFLLILMFSSTADNYDYDLWARLIAGMGFVDGGHVLTQDFLSYTPVHTWWDHEWGAGVIFYSVLKYFGPYSLVILHSLLIFGIFFFASKIIKLRFKNPYNILFYLFAFMAFIGTTNEPVRCHLFSFLFFTILIYIFEYYRKNNNAKILYIIPIIMLFWNNIHGGVVSGIGLMLMYAFGEFLNKKPFKHYLIILGITVPILFINPWGYDYIKFLLMANTMPRPDIVEWWGIFSKFHFYKHIMFKVFMFAMIGVQAVYVFKSIKSKDWFKNIDKTKYIVLLATFYLSFNHVKLIPFFVIASLCFIYEDFYKLVENIKLPKYQNKLVYGLLLFVSLFTFTVKDISVPVGFDRYPVKEVEFIKINGIKGKILSNFGYGSYISYKLYPNNKIFMDGRYEEVYYDYMIPLLKNFHLANQYWDEILKYFPPDVMIIEKAYPIFKVLNANNNWDLIYESEKFGVYIPSKSNNKKYVQPSKDINYYKSNLFTTDIKF